METPYYVWWKHVFLNPAGINGLWDYRNRDLWVKKGWSMDILAAFAGTFIRMPAWPLMHAQTPKTCIRVLRHRPFQGGFPNMGNWPYWNRKIIRLYYLIIYHVTLVFILNRHRNCWSRGHKKKPDFLGKDPKIVADRKPRKQTVITRSEERTTK